MPGKKNDSHDADRQNVEHTDPDQITADPIYTDDIEDLIRTYNLDQNKITVQTDENGMNHLVVDLGYLTSVDGSLLRKMEEDFQLQRKDIIEKVSAKDPEVIHQEFLADQGDNENNLDLAVYWYRDCSVQFELHNYIGALDWIIPTEELKKIQLPLADRIDSHRSDFPDRDMTLADLLTTWTPDGGSRKSLLDQILEEIGQADLVPVESITMKKPKSLVFATDPTTRAVFNQTAELWQKKVAVKTGKDSSMIFSTIIDPEFLKETGLTTSQPLDADDWALYLACASAIMEGNRKVTFNYLDKRAGGNGVLSDKEKEEMKERLIRFRHIDFMEDTSREVNMKYDPYSYNDAFMYVSIISGKMMANGGMADGCVFFPEVEQYKILPLIDLAIQRGQITTFPANVLNTPGRKSKGKKAMELHILGRIAAARNGSLVPDILLESIYASADIKPGDRKKEHNYRQYAVTDLDYWSSDTCKIIEGYEFFEKGDQYTELVTVRRNGKYIREKQLKTHQGPGIHLKLLKEDQQLPPGSNQKKLQ